MRPIHSPKPNIVVALENIEENRIPLTPSILKLDAHLHEQTKQAKNKMKVRLNNNRRKKIPKLQLIDESSSSTGPYGGPCTQHSDTRVDIQSPFTTIAGKKRKANQKVPTKTKLHLDESDSSLDTKEDKFDQSLNLLGKLLGLNFEASATAIESSTTQIVRPCPLSAEEQIVKAYCFDKDLESRVNLVVAQLTNAQRRLFPDKCHRTWYFPTYVSQHIMNGADHAKLCDEYFGESRYTGKLHACQQFDKLERFRLLVDVVNDSSNRIYIEVMNRLKQYKERYSRLQKARRKKKGMHGHADALEERTTVDGLDAILDELAYIMHKVSCELSCKCSSGADAHATTMAILNMLSNYSWDAKVVISLAAFAVNYGQFWLVTQLVTSNQLAKSIALLKQLPNIIEHASTLKSRFHAIKNLIKVLLDVTKCIVQFKELPLQHIASTTEAWELSSLAHKISNIDGHLKNQLGICHHHIETFQMLIRLFEMSHVDNVRILKALIYSKDDQLPLVEGTTKKKANMEVLKRETVLLFISDLDISHDEIMYLSLLHQDTRTRTGLHYQIVWLPIMDRSTKPLNDANQQNFEQLQMMMQYSIRRNRNTRKSNRKVQRKGLRTRVS
ncbi:Protein SIEVE ELEMENT OCCLUSION B [Camellia lanceoleosa]|uniref:Protein SIEVE ELEMENT OCCLUSION B n=1 Tax=Camellia lanceoleosa TaxID=1840588 RepID=A0ACC0I2U6_9ERIC|nr:Protein SIEVE ELEMENT OCCLUSION B [Camellia lanceoleosa]